MAGKSLYIVHHADTACQCEPDDHQWIITAKGGVLYRECRICFRAECTHPGVQRCWYMPDEDAHPATLEALPACLRKRRCEVLTTSVCDECDLPMCSDHLAEHQEVEHGW